MSGSPERLNGHRDIRQNPAYTLSRGLGWFSIGLGTAQLVMPNAVSRLAGFGPGGKRRALQRLTGARELMTGVGILASPRPAPWLWARVGGDVMDLAMLGGAFGVKGESRGRVKKSMTAVLGVTAADLAGAMQLTAAGGSATGTRPSDGSIPVERAITVWRQPEEVYGFWKDFENLPGFMNHLESVQIIDDRRSHWMAKGPAGRKVEWDAEITEDRPNELIAWRSLEGSRVSTTGDVRFVRSPDGQGTEVHVHMHYKPPAGAVGMTITLLFGEDPTLQLREDLLRFKQQVETGEIARSDA
ncbi:MAG TPA: SRPBCC family protein, partial [Thermomicrobiales bacterium]|nr:SRPBCC family protein [Thermomicrobiales bacterium]